MRPVLLLLLAASVSLTACGGSAKRSADLLYDIRAYNEGVRWRKLPQAAVRIPPSEREAFLDEREQLEEELRIDDFEITRLKMTGERQKTADVQIKWTWHMDSRGIVKTTTSKQAWRRYGKRWLLLEEAHVRGDKMPGIPDMPEPNDDSAGEEDKAANDEDEGPAPRESSADSVGYRQVRAALRTAENTHRITQ